MLGCGGDPAAAQVREGASGLRRTGVSLLSLGEEPAGGAAPSRIFLSAGASFTGGEGRVLPALQLRPWRDGLGGIVGEKAPSSGAWGAREDAAQGAVLGSEEARRRGGRYRKLV